VITDPELVSQFNIWNGPGVETRGPDGVRRPPEHLDSDQSAGRFIDWPRGIANQRPPGLQRLEVTFVMDFQEQQGNLPSYRFAYERDPSESGFIYLPDWTNSLISHGVEGNWFHASDRWNELIGPIVANRTTHLLPPAERGKLSCIVGHGSLGEDGTVEFTLLDEAGNETSHWRYDVSADGYERVRAHIGNVAPGEEIEVSCWPQRTL
jgi:hypothetical protein